MPITIGRDTTLDEDHELADMFYPQDVKIGKFCQIGPRVVFCGAINHITVTHPKAVTPYSFAYHWKLPYFEYTVSRGPIKIGHDVWIGRDVFILDGVKIGTGATIGAKSVVAKNIPPYAVATGNPARVRHYRFKPEQIKALLKIKWWNWSNKRIRERIEDFKDIDVFIKKYGHKNG